MTSLSNIRKVLLIAAVVLIALALIAASRDPDNLTAIGMAWQFWLCAALTAFFGAVLTKEITP